MTQVKIPNAVAHMTPSGSRVLTDRETRSMQVEGWDRNKHLEYYSVPLISVVDATAYADARVREALEDAYLIARDVEKSLLSDRLQHVSGAAAANFVVNRIRALIP